MTVLDLIQLNTLIETLRKTSYEQGLLEDKLCGEDVETAAQEVGDAASSLRSFVITLSANKK